MSTPESVLAQIDDLIGMAEETTGQSFDNLTDAVEELCEGYGTGSGDVGEEEPCGHGTTTLQYVSGGNGQHTVKTVCSVCGQVVSEGAEACADETGDGLCDMCGAAVDTGDEEVCSHVNTTEETISNGNGSHTVKVTCTDCGVVVSERNEKCSPFEGAKVTSNGDGTHTSVRKCGDCKGTISEVIEPCEDADGDGLCDVCGAAIDTGEEWTGEDYAGELNSVERCCFYFTGENPTKLACMDGQGSTEYALAAAGGTTSDEKISGKAVLPIAIPPKASSITITSTDGNMTEVEIVVFAGTKDSVTNSYYETKESNDSAEFSLVVEPGAYQFVVFNVIGNYNAWTSPEDKATIHFG